MDPQDGFPPIQMRVRSRIYVRNVVKTGDPTRDGLPVWPQAITDRHDVLNFSLEDGPVFVPEPRPGVELVARARVGATRQAS